MSERYIQEVSRALCLPKRRRREVLRDLREIFESAAEHGETEAQVIARLGTPREFAQSAMEEMGVDPRSHLRRRRLLTVALPLFLALACAGAAWLLRAQLPPKNVIGGAEALTGIQVVGDAPFALWQALLAAGGVAALCAAAFALRELKNRRKTS